MVSIIRTIWRRSDGGIALEAALVMPLFLGFILALASMIKLTMTDLALQRALTETTKPIVAYAYPAELLAEEARAAYASSRVGSAVTDILNRVSSARGKQLQGELLADRYEAYIPDFLLRLIEWEQTERESLETMSQDQIDAFKEQRLNPAIRAVFRQLVIQGADPLALSVDRLKVVDVDLPQLGSREEAFIGITAEYEVRLPIPFYRKSITLRKQVFERLWVGS